MEKVCYTRIDYNELEDIICQFYDLKMFSVVATEEWSNDEEHSYDVKKENLNNYQNKNIRELRHGENPMYCLNSILTDLANNDVLEEGKYLIDVSW